MTSRARHASRTGFKKTVYDNGLTLVTERHPEFRSLAIGVWVKVGTRHEGPGEAGISHFLEHMLFKGTKSRSALEIAREVDRVGGDFNAFTAREHTCFHILLLDRDLSLGLELLSDVILDSAFDAEELERERKVILQEISMIDETPEELAHDFFFERVFPDHGLGRPILGSERSIRKMRRKDLLDFFRMHYRPDQLVLSVAGDVSHEQVRRRLGPLRRRDWPGRRKGAEPTQAPATVPVMREGHWWETRNTEQVHLIWGVEGPGHATRDRFAAFLLNLHLGGGMSSELFQEIREKRGLAYTVYSTLTPFADTGVFSVYAATGMKEVPLCLKLIEESARKLATHPLSRDELRLAKESLKGTILISADSAESRMFSIARNEMLFGRYVALEEMMMAIDAVTPGDVQRLASHLLGSRARSVLAVGPKPSPVLRKRLRGLGFR